MIDPVHFTDYNRTDAQLEEVALFSILVAGKAALPTARRLELLLYNARQEFQERSRRPFRILRWATPEKLADFMRAVGLGCYNTKSRAMYELVQSGINLRTCTVNELDAIFGIGPKTARMFVLHTRPNQRIAVLDTHVLKYLDDCGYRAPKSTPASTKRYEALETLCLMCAELARMTPADWDLMIWNKYRTRRKP
jgi:thermostable 8-oxoguanine DNA glycosylase